MSGTVSPLARSRSASRRICATSWAVLRLLMSPSVTQSTGGLPFRLDQILGSRPSPNQLSPQPFKPNRSGPGVADGVSDVLVPEIILDEACVEPFVGEIVARRMTQHVRMNCYFEL